MKKRGTSSEENFFSSEETFWKAFLVQMPAKESQIGSKMSILLASHTKETSRICGSSDFTRSLVICHASCVVRSARHRAEQPGLSETSSPVPGTVRQQELRAHLTKP